MAETVSINGLTLCHKNSSGFVMSTLPDICKSPGAPVPYTNVAFAKDLANGTTTVFSHGGAMNGIKGSEFAKSIGDEPGVGFGVKSGTQLDKATFLSWSPNVFMDGSPVTRLTDKMLLNSGNTISAGGYYTGPVTVNLALMNKLCNYACDCKDAGLARQSCVEAAMRADPTNVIDKDNGVFPEVDFRPDGSLVRKADGFPSSQRGVPGSRLDVVQLTGGAPSAIVEMKFFGDRFRGNQFSRYTNLAKMHGLPLDTIDVPTQCACDDPNKKPVPVPDPVPAPAPEEEPTPQGSWADRHPVLTGIGIGVGILAVAALAVVAGPEILAGAALAAAL
jgi:hypothetical protein